MKTRGEILKLCEEMPAGHYLDLGADELKAAFPEIPNLLHPQGTPVDRLLCNLPGGFYGTFDAREIASGAAVTIRIKRYATSSEPFRAEDRGE